MSVGFLATDAGAQTFDVDFSRRADYPLVKTKFGVYQTPLTTLPRLLDSVPLLREVSVSELRYEMGWGKPDVLAASQIGGTATRPTYDFSVIDAFTQKLKQAGVRPLLAMTYCPDPLKSREGWPAWKDTPSNLTTWQTINRDYALHLKNTGSSYEIWNEPDMPDPGGKMFFSGGPQQYAELYSHGAGGIRQGDSDALVGGPAAAYDMAYLAPILSQPIDFASIHGYDNFPLQISLIRGALDKRPDLPIFLTEYASFTDFPGNGPQSRHMAAMRFFRDVKGMLTYPDVTKVYWAQWLDAGNGPGMGLITYDGHRKALFNAFKIYGDLPTDRNAVSSSNANGVDLMAASDKHRAGIVLWNTSNSNREVKVNLNRLPFSRGTLQLSRIDKNHASYVDDASSENLQVLQTLTFDKNISPSWSGVVPAEAVVYLKVSDGERSVPLANPKLGTFIRSYHQFSKRDSKAFADFDPQTWTARLGMGDSDSATAQIGNVIENPATRIRVQVEKSGDFLPASRNSHFGIRIDFQLQNGGYGQGVLLHNGSYEPQSGTNFSLKQNQTASSRAILQSRLNTGRPFEIKLAKIAPADWNRRRIMMTFWMQNTGRGSQAKFTLAKL